MSSPHTLHHLALSLLHPHPMNANRMAPELMEKLRAQIAETGNYEPLIVRPHPSLKDEYQLINGHHRCAILRELGHPTAACLVWSLTDAQTLLLLATINRLEGRDIPGKRLSLLQALALEIDPAELGRAVPEDAQTLEAMLSPCPPPPIAEAPEVDRMPEPLTIFLASADKRRVLAALDATGPDRAAALLSWADAKTAERQNAVQKL